MKVSYKIIFFNFYFVGLIEQASRNPDPQVLSKVLSVIKVLEDREGIFFKFHSILQSVSIEKKHFEHL